MWHLAREKRGLISPQMEGCQADEWKEKSVRVKDDQILRI